MTTPTKLRSVGIIDVEFGANVTVIQPTNLYGCVIGEGTFVGPFVEIQRGAVIGKRCKIQSHAFVCDLVTIRDDCVISHGVMFINDLFSTGGPAHGDRDLWKSTIIGNHVSIGTNSTILPVSRSDSSRMELCLSMTCSPPADPPMETVIFGNPPSLAIMSALVPTPQFFQSPFRSEEHTSE